MNWMEAFINGKPFGTQWKWKGNLRRTNGQELWYKHWAIAKWDEDKPCHLILIKFRISHLDFSHQTFNAITRTHNELGKFIQEHSGFTLEWKNYNE